MNTSSSRPPERPSTLRQISSVPLYRGATIATLLSGLGTSAAAPQIILYLVRELGTPLPVAGLYYLTSLAAPFAGYFIGRLSDRTGNRLGLFRLCALAGFLGWAGIALSSAAWMPFVISTFVLAFSGAAASQIFAAIHDELSKTPDEANESVVAIIRMALTAGWVIGPVIGAWFAAEIGLRALLWITAICSLAQIVPLGRIKVTAPAKADATAPDLGPVRNLDLRTLMPLLAFTGLFVLVYAGEPVKYGFLLMYMEDELHLEPALRGAVIGVQPLVELMIMPFTVVIGRRIGMLWTMCFAALLAFCADLCFAFWPSAAGMFAGQILMGGVWAMFMVLGIIVAQRLLPGAVATASAVFMNAPALASAVGGAAGGTGLALVGLPHVFLIPAIFALLAALGLASMARSQKSGTQPIVRAFDRWRLARATKHLSPHLMKDAGLETEEGPFGGFNSSQPNGWNGKLKV